MIIKFKLFEVQQQLYNKDKTNRFSLNHRFPNLPGYATMMDIDNVGVLDGNIVYVMEDKHKFETISAGNILLNSGHTQRIALIGVAKAMKCDLIFYQKITDSYHKIDINKNKNELCNISYINGIKKIDTSYKIYVEYRGSRYNKIPIAVMFRTNNMSDAELSSDKNYLIAKAMSKKMKVGFYLVNDVLEDNSIIIQKGDDTKNYKKIVDINSEYEWTSVYRHFGIL